MTAKKERIIVKQWHRVHITMMSLAAIRLHMNIFRLIYMLRHKQMRHREKKTRME